MSCYAQKISNIFCISIGFLSIFLLHLTPISLSLWDESEILFRKDIFQKVNLIFPFFIRNFFHEVP